MTVLFREGWNKMTFFDVFIVIFFLIVGFFSGIAFFLKQFDIRISIEIESEADPIKEAIDRENKEYGVD